MNLTAIAEELLQLAEERRALTYGDFVLSSGRRSSYYFDGRRLTLDAKGAYLVGMAFWLLLQGSGVDAIGGPTLGADPIVTAVALTGHLQGKPIDAFIVRKEAKAHGTGQLVEGPLARGSRVAIVDDSCSTGASLIQAVDAALAMECTVVKVLAILDRKQGGSDELRRRGCEFLCLMEASPEGVVRVSGDLALKPRCCPSRGGPNTPHGVS